METDFHNSRRELECLDVFVLAVPKSTAQLQTRLGQLRDDFAIDLNVPNMAYLPQKSSNKRRINGIWSILGDFVDPQETLDFTGAPSRS